MAASDIDCMALDPSLPDATLILDVQVFKLLPDTEEKV
jgi:hypothetical protein